jgi:ubiquitin C-terminal hydrolase
VPNKVVKCFLSLKKVNAVLHQNFFLHGISSDKEQTMPSQNLFVYTQYNNHKELARAKVSKCNFTQRALGVNQPDCRSSNIAENSKATDLMT